MHQLIQQNMIWHEKTEMRDMTTLIKRIGKEALKEPYLPVNKPRGGLIGTKAKVGGWAYIRVFWVYLDCKPGFIFEVCMYLTNLDNKPGFKNHLQHVFG